jgi:hypothetical protein
MKMSEKEAVCAFFTSSFAFCFPWMLFVDVLAVNVASTSTSHVKYMRLGAFTSMPPSRKTLRVS